MDACVDTCSLGTRQKLCVLLALLGDPTLVLLDEAFNGLDPNSSLVLKQHLHQRLDAGRCSVLLATHALDMIERHADAAGLLLIQNHEIRQALPASCVSISATTRTWAGIRLQKNTRLRSAAECSGNLAAACLCSLKARVPYAKKAAVPNAQY